MPPDFFAFWDFCVFLNRSNPREAFLDIAGLRLVGPFDLMPDSPVNGTCADKHEKNLRL
jgi:hypothetical protein